MISVIIPTFNTKKEWLRKAITSALDQTYPDVELIVVDDCSNIPFSGLEREIADPRIRWFRNEENLGVSATRNRGAGEAKGKWLAFLDADDWWAPEKLALQIELMENNELKWVYSSAFQTTQNGDVVSISRAQHKGNVFRKVLVRQIIIGSCSGVLVERTFFESLGGFDATGKAVEEDWDMWIRFARKAPTSFIDKPLVFLRTFGTASRSAELGARLERVKNLFDKYREDLAEHDLERYAKAHYNYVAARQYYIRGSWMTAAIHLARAWVACPRYFSSDRLKLLFKKVRLFQRVSKSI